MLPRSFSTTSLRLPSRFCRSSAERRSSIKTPPSTAFSPSLTTQAATSFSWAPGRAARTFTWPNFRAAEARSKGSPLNLGANAAELHTVQWDGQSVTLEGGYDPGKGKPHTWPQAVYRLKISGSSATIAQTIKLKAFNKEEQTSWITPGLNSLVLTQGKIRIFKYPAGGNVMKRLLTGQGPAYMATVAAPADR